jgi:hypothetical protein
MVLVVGIDVGVERAGIDQQSYRPASWRRISSMRSDTSVRPLRPAFAPPNCRPESSPKWTKIASRVSSEMVVPRLSASCRSRASTSSGSFMVVRFMICQHIMISLSRLSYVRDRNESRLTKSKATLKEWVRQHGIWHRWSPRRFTGRCIGS